MSEREPHPLRLWWLQKDLGENLQALRDWTAESRRKYGQPVGGVQFIERPEGIDRRMVRSFRDLQLLLFKRDEATLFLDSFLQFWDQYRLIYSFDPAVSEALSQTDVSDIPWSEVRLPHPECYVALGDYGQSSFFIGEFEYIIDGV